MQVDSLIAQIFESFSHFPPGGRRGEENSVLSPAEPDSHVRVTLTSGDKSFSHAVCVSIFSSEFFNGSHVFTFQTLTNVNVTLSFVGVVPV